MKQSDFRHEYKHVINLLDYHAIRIRLKAAARPDPNGRDGRYHIRSLYFDNDDDKALREKVNGNPNREKFRIRLYNHNAGMIRLEKKSKINGLCRKQSAVLTREQTERIINGDTGWMRDCPEPLLPELYVKMNCQRIKPRTIVDYWREAYIYPLGNVRVTFDSEVRTGLYAKGLFNKEIPTLPVRERGLLLLEVKYDSYLPDIMRDLIQTNTRHTEAFSKYAACRMYG